MNIKSAKVIPGCISCKNCENICPEIFKVDPTSHVISDTFNQNASKLLMAEKMCPVNVIKVEKEGELDMTYSEATLKSKKYLTPDVVELIFSCKNFEFIAGQYVSLQMSDTRGDFSRSYSIASATKNSFTLTIKLLKKGRGSSYLRELGERTWTRGFFKQTKIQYLGPLGDFKLQDTNNKKVLIATGTGLAPMMTMLDAIPDDIPKLLVFGGRYEEDIFYRNKLEKYKNLELRICVSGPSQHYTGNIGRVTDYINDIDPSDEVYICGNPEMVSDVRNTLEADGHDKNKIFHEDFTLAHTPLPLWQDILYQGNLRGIDTLNTVSIYFGALIIPVFYFFAVWFNWLGIEILSKDIYSILFLLSWITLVFVMFIRPLADIFPKLNILRKLVVLRKGFGIISASIIVCILLAKWIQNPFTFSAFFSISAWSLWMGLFARLSETTAIILLATSNTFSQRILGIWWKRIQKTSYVYFVTGGILAAQWSENPNSYYITIGLLVIAWLLARFGVKFGGIKIIYEY